MAWGAYAVGFHGFARVEFLHPEFSTPVGPGDALAMARAVEAVMEREAREPGWCRARGQVAAGYIAGEYSPERERDDVVGLYRGLLSPGGR